MPSDGGGSPKATQRTQLPPVPPVPPDFSADEYIACNPDLAGITEHEAMAHYLLHGTMEARAYRRSRNRSLPPDFNAAAYRDNHEDLLGLSDDELELHYLDFGSVEGRWYRSIDDELPASFDVEQYVYFNPDLAAISKHEAKLHYIHHGQPEGRKYLDDLFDSSGGESHREYRNDVRRRKSDKAAELLDTIFSEMQLFLQRPRERTIVFVDHDEGIRTGASAYLLHLMKFVMRMTVLVLVPGKLQEKRQEYERTLHEDLLVVDYHDDSHVLYWLLKHVNGDLVLLNSASYVYVDILPFRCELGKRVVLHSHEFPEDYTPWTLLRCVPDFVVGDVIAEIYEAEAKTRPMIQPPIMAIDVSTSAPASATDFAFEDQQQALKGQLARYRLVVLMAGVLCHRKNPKLFNDLARLHPDMAFVWMGSTAGDSQGILTEANAFHVPHNRRWLELARFLGVDVFLLTSIRDPCPYVVIEALAAQIPVITFGEAVGHRHPPLDGLHTSIPGEPSAQRAAPYLRVLASARKTPRTCEGARSPSMHLATYLELFANPTEEYASLLQGA